MDQETEVVIEIEKNAVEKVMISRRIFEGTEYADFRLWYKDENSKTWLPTRRGFILTMEKAQELADSMTLLANK